MTTDTFCPPVNGSQFCSVFRRVTGHLPFPWQETLYARFVGEAEGGIPKVASIPTGLGKTSVIAVWLLALAKYPEKMPRRLVYVVNRRTVVDQTTREAEKLKTAVEAGKLPGIDQLVISTLRGQFADNGEWRSDPSRPAVICGTVDMVGSRLLFSGYRIGFKSRPLHAGFLGQDTLLVHDEAHLEPAFQRLIETIEGEQIRERDGKATLSLPNLRVMALSATTRSGSEGQTSRLSLDAKDHQHPEIQKRSTATKTLRLHSCSVEDKQLVSHIVKQALVHQETGKAVLIFLRRVPDALEVLSELEKQLPGQVAPLTGTMRGYERDVMTGGISPNIEKDSKLDDSEEFLKARRIFARFMPRADLTEDVTLAESTVYLVCTSAGEVGVNISADHMVCDLSTFENMAQRMGRVNRFGDRDDTYIDVVHPKEDAFDDMKPNAQRKATLKLLRLLNGDASPKALGELMETLSEDELNASFAPPPATPQATDILFDAWAMTTIREDMPGRPPVAPYLHGIAEWEPQRTRVAWRKEVEIIDEALIQRHGKQFPTTLLDDFPLKPHELLSDTTERVYKALDDLAKRAGTDCPVWLVNERGRVTVKQLRALLAEEKKRVVERLADSTILLPQSLGGLEKGMLDGKAKHAKDVADQWYEKDQHRRLRLWNEETPPPGMALVCTVDIKPDTEESPPADTSSDTEDGSKEPSQQRRFWRWYVRPKDAEDATSASLRPIPLKDHTDDVVRRASEIVTALNLPKDIKQAVILAAELHDLGKRRELWQRSIGNPNPKKWYAKPGKPEGERRWQPRHISDYRHEFGSLLDVLDKNSEFASRLADLNEDAQDIVLHLIASHHGYARPHFPLEQTVDPHYAQSEADTISVEVMRRYARLQRRYGRWGLAYIESLLRAADWAASAKPTVNDAPKEVLV